MTWASCFGDGFDGFNFNDDFIVADKIGSEFLFQLFALIIDGCGGLWFKGNVSEAELFFQAFLKNAL